MSILVSKPLNFRFVFGVVGVVCNIIDCVVSDHSDSDWVPIWWSIYSNQADDNNNVAHMIILTDAAAARAGALPPNSSFLHLSYHNVTSMLMWLCMIKLGTRYFRNGPNHPKITLQMCFHYKDIYIRLTNAAHNSAGYCCHIAWPGWQVTNKTHHEATNDALLHLLFQSANVTLIIYIDVVSTVISFLIIFFRDNCQITKIFWCSAQNNLNCLATKYL